MSHFHKFTVADKFKVHTLVSVYFFPLDLYMKYFSAIHIQIENM